jgi:hypothetical protein
VALAVLREAALQEIGMSKGNRGNKEAKKPKRAVAVAKPLGVEVSVAPLRPGARPALPKK